MAEAMEIEQLVRELNDSRNQSSPEVIDTLQKRIQRLQRDHRAWEWGKRLLNHNDPVMRFYGALTLTIKINADWDGDKFCEDRNLVNGLIESLVSSYVRLAGIPDVPFVLQKLCTTLVTVFQRPQSAWALPIRHLIACTIANRYIPPESIPDITSLLNSGGTIAGAQLRSLLMFPMTLAEQDSTLSGSVKEQGTRVRISNNIPDILHLIHFTSTSLVRASNNDTSITIHPYSLGVTYDQTQFFDVARAMLQLVPLWTADIRVKGSRNANTTGSSNFDLFESTLKSFLLLFQREALAPIVLQSLTALEESSHSLLKRTLPGYEQYIITSTQAKSWIEQLVAGDFDPDAIAYVNLLEACISQVDVTSPDYLATGFYIEILKQVQTLLQCDGAPGVEDPICQIALEILTSVTEGFSDWDGESPYDESMRDLIKTACIHAMSKIRIPIEELNITTQTWDADDRAKFQDFRYDVQDYLQNTFGILGDSLIEEITKATVEATSPAEWNIFEASLFSFIAFSDALSNEPEKYDQYVAAVFNSEMWRVAMHAAIEVPDRVRQIIIKVIGENTSFLQRQTTFLVSSLNFLFTSLHVASSTTAASKAISTLCDAQRSMLTEALPQFMISLTGTADIEADAKHRIYAGVGAIIQALPTETDKIQPLTQILHHLLHQGVDANIDPSATPSEQTAKAVDILQTISSLGRGLRAPSDLPIDLEATPADNQLFWIDGPGSVVQQQMLHIYQTLLQRTNGQHDSTFVEAACSFLRAGFTEAHPSPFKFPNAKTLELLSIYMQVQCPEPDQVMSTATSYLASVQPQDPDNEFHTLLLMSVRAVNNTFVAHKSENQPLNTDFCTASLDSYTRLLPKWAPTLFSMTQAQDIINLIIETAFLLHRDSDTLPRRTAASFFTGIFEASSQPTFTSNPTSPSTTTMTNTLQTFAPRIIASTIHLLAGVCARSDIDSLAETIKKAVVKQPLIATKLIREALKDESGVLTPRALQATRPEQRARFAAQVEMLRGQRKTNEVLKEFWIACKGREFEYVI